MKREEHYCDICGKQTTEQYADGDTVKVGIEIKNVSQEGLQISMTKRHSCGSSEKSAFLHCSEYCSFYCFNNDIQRVLSAVKEFMK